MFYEPQAEVLAHKSEHWVQGFNKLLQLSEESQPVLKQQDGYGGFVRAILFDKCNTKFPSISQQSWGITSITQEYQVSLRILCSCSHSILSYTILV